MYSDDDSFPIKCPYCKHEFFEKIGRIKTGVTVCPASGCHSRIAHPAKEFALILSDQGSNARRDYFGRFMRLTGLQ